MCLLNKLYLLFPLQIDFLFRLQFILPRFNCCNQCYPWLDNEQVIVINLNNSQKFWIIWENPDLISTKTALRIINNSNDLILHFKNCTQCSSRCWLARSEFVNGKIIPRKVNWSCPRPIHSDDGVRLSRYLSSSSSTPFLYRSHRKLPLPGAHTY